MKIDPYKQKSYDLKVHIDESKSHVVHRFNVIDKNNNPTWLYYYNTHSGEIVYLDL